MSPEIIEQLHRIEHKLDKIIECIILGEASFGNINEESICPMCKSVIRWRHNTKGQAIRDCDCNMKFKSIDMEALQDNNKVKGK